MRPTGADLDALRTLRDAWGEEGFVLIGASALAVRVESRWRTTRDVDLVVAASPSEVLRTLEGIDGWRRESRQPHRWHAPGGARLDVIPANEALLRIGAVEWPETGTRLSLEGMRLALAHADPIELAPDLRVRVPVAGSSRS